MIKRMPFLSLTQNESLKKHTIENNKRIIKMRFSLLWKVYKMKKVNESSPFCPKSTMNLTYLCYGDSNI